MNEINTTTTTEQATKRAAMVEKLTHRMTMVERNGEKRGKVQRLSKKDFPGGKDVYDAYVKTLVYASIMFSRS